MNTILFVLKCASGIIRKLSRIIRLKIVLVLYTVHSYLVITKKKKKTHNRRMLIDAVYSNANLLCTELWSTYQKWNDLISFGLVCTLIDCNISLHFQRQTEYPIMK